MYVANLLLQIYYTDIMNYEYSKVYPLVLWNFAITKFYCLYYILHCGHQNNRKPGLHSPKRIT